MKDRKLMTEDEEKVEQI